MKPILHSTLSTLSFKEILVHTVDHAILNGLVIVQMGGGRGQDSLMGAEMDRRYHETEETIILKNFKLKKV